MILCCLCTTPQTHQYQHLQNCFGDYNKEIYEIVVKYFDHQLLKERIKSKFSAEAIICQICWLHLSGFHNFQQTIFKIKNILEQRAQRLPLTLQVLEANVPTVISDDYDVNEQLKQTNSSPRNCDLQQTILKLETPLEQTCIQRSPLHIKDEEQHLLAVLSDDYIGNREFEFAKKKHSANESPREEQQLNKDLAKNYLEEPNVENSVNVTARTTLNIANSEISVLNENYFPSAVDSTAASQHTKIEPGFQKCKCDICGKILYQRNLKRHVLTHTEGNRDFKCEECGKAYVLEIQLKNHMRQCLNKITCEKCGKILNPASLARHMKLHIDNAKLPCDECGKELANYTTLKSHKATYHSCKAKFPCTECGKELANLRSLKEHKERIHTDGYKPKYSCDKCGRKFRQSTSIKDHKEICQGDGSMVYVCSICGKVKPTERRLRFHKKSAHDKKPKMQKPKHKCPYCDKVFKVSKSVREHIACCHTKKPLYRCAHCPKSFYAHEVYRMHSKKVHLISLGEVQNEKIDYKLVKNIAII